MSASENGSNPVRTVAVSAPDSPDKELFGLRHYHLVDMREEIAVQLLASGICLSYSCDLREDGLTEQLFDSVLRYRGHRTHSGTITVTNYLAWPVHVSMAPDALATFLAGHEQAADVVLLDPDGNRMGLEDRLVLPEHSPSADEWVEGLTSLRRVMCAESDARIALGGDLEGHKGRMPGVAEEAMLSLQSQQPVFLIGGFGGCTRDIAEIMGLADPKKGTPRPDWDARDFFKGLDHESLNNGLTLEENRQLARIPHLGLAVILVRRGLNRCWTKVEAAAF